MSSGDWIVPDGPKDAQRRDTASAAYADRLVTAQQAWWKRILPVQAPYRWNLRRHRLGRTLEIGCGIGRNLKALPDGSIGVDHNAKAVASARAQGLVALTVDEWEESALRIPGAFDSLLVAHVVEHMELADARSLLLDYLPYVRPGGHVLLICPQERGYRSDPTHVRFFDEAALAELAIGADLQVRRTFSFPFPRWAGNLFIYNEFCLFAQKEAAAV